MTLFEITTGRTGVSYERCYIWALDEEIAKELFRIKYPKAKLKEITSLFESFTAGFITNLSDDGFDTDDLL